MKRNDFLNYLGLITAAVPLTSLADVPSNRKAAGIAIPGTAFARDAEELALASEPSEIFNHSLRTFLFAELIGRARNLEHDSELLYVASILHDTGLSKQYMSKNQRFEVDGANLSRQLLQKHGITGDRADLGNSRSCGL